MKKTATIILNRNLPLVTESLYNSIERNNSGLTDIFIVESGSDKDKLARNYTWWANWDEAMTHGLRIYRGFNYALSRLWKENRFNQYDYFFLLTNDTEFEDKPVLDILLDEMNTHKQVGILSPCSQRWGERNLIGSDSTKYFWDVNNVAYIMRREFIESIMKHDNPDHMDFMYDGTNFCGYGAHLELIAKGYANDWATAITTRVWVEENETHLKTKADLIKTEPFEIIEKETWEEDKKWMRQKYGFNSRWTMQMYVKFFYDQFFCFHPEYEKFKI